MKVVLISAPYFDVYGALNVGRNHTLSLGLGYIASVLRKEANYEVYWYDPEPLGATENDIKDYLKEKSPDLVAISSATPNFKGAVKMGRLAKEVTSALVVIGGVHASAVPELTLKENPHAFDIVVIGEGELTMLELCEAIEKGRELDNVAGLLFRKNHSLHRTTKRDLITDLDSIPFPARDLVDLNLYRPQVHLYRGRKSATMITSRGCPARCTYCATQVTMGNKFRVHSAEYVVKEIEHLVKNYGIEDVIIVDDTFTINKKRVIDICNLLIEKNIKIGWFCFVRVNDASYELFELMKKAGCFSMFFGVESGDEQVLKNIKKGTTIAQARNALKISNKLGFKTMAGFMFGNPGDNKETIEKTIKLALELNPIIGSFNIMTPFPGTEEYDRYTKSHPCQIMNWDIFVPKGVTPVIELVDLTKKDLQKCIYKAYLRFYLRPLQIFRIIRNMSSFAEFRVYLRGAFGLFRRMFEWRRAGK
ncbi:MAG: radical SAM protein [bacterium]